MESEVIIPFCVIQIQHLFMALHFYKFGHIGGAQALMCQQDAFAYFVHCAAHSLNLVLKQAVSSISPVKVFFANVGYFSTFSTSSPHRKVTS